MHGLASHSLISCRITIVNKKFQLKLNQFCLFTIFSFISRVAYTTVVVDFVLAHGSVNTWIGFTFVNVQLANGSRKTSARTVALEATKLIDTWSIVVTWIWFTVVDVDLTNSTSHARNTNTSEVRHSVNASWSFRARVGCALVDVNIALFSVIAWCTAAFKVIYSVDASCTIFAWNW